MALPPFPSVGKRFQLMILLYSLLAVLQSPGGTIVYGSECDNSQNYNVNRAFHDNLINVFDSMSSGASLSFSGFYNSSSVGNDTVRAYGLFLCLGFVSQDKCKSCVDKAIRDMLRECISFYHLTVDEKYCLLSYSDQNFIECDGYSVGFSDFKHTEPLKYIQAVREMLGELSEEASYSATMYAFRDYTSEFEKLYGLVQCPMVLSKSGCRRCLQSAIEKTLLSCNGSIGATFRSKTCYLRHDIFDFTEGAPPSSVPTSHGHDQVKASKKILFIIISTWIAGIFILSFCIYSLVVARQGNQQNGRGRAIDEAVPLQQIGVQIDQMQPPDLPLISLATIHAATINFSDSNILGQGGFGPVYKGVLPNGREVAIKRLSNGSEQGSVEFMNEISLILKLQHKNLVRLLGCCTEGEERILVYEYMPNGSLDFFLFDQRRQTLLDWSTRYNIICGIAHGILYLHEDSRLRIIHRHLKASNVLLDKGMNPKISDFGMARIFPGNIGEANTATIVGTYGYMAPEYAMEGVYSTKSDVYSFGVLLLEIVSGRKNAGFHRSEHAPSLLDYAWQLWKEGKGLELMYPLLVETYCESEVLRCINVGLLCVTEDAMDRPTMSQVIVMLRSESLSLPQPQQPSFSVGRFTPTTIDDVSINHVTITDVIPR
ncbi:cysteine-rich receptor-like protein kinase 10 isoform X2 [Macadamia integrifolia]|uniref:cysteine-rich receptor-like protein kinase 10 isoform X2 n=1 Tax=Macadamia integrifolia TaxID=60698 RepID=UPI001C527C66|nr:cysteine-rich receptor-like protein kinase 10 isoform X2 [Macadamia integrifolia]